MASFPMVFGATIGKLLFPSLSVTSFYVARDASLEVVFYYSLILLLSDGSPLIWPETRPFVTGFCGEFFPFLCCDCGLTAPRIPVERRLRHLVRPKLCTQKWQSHARFGQISVGLFAVAGDAHCTAFRLSASLSHRLSRPRRKTDYTRYRPAVQASPRPKQKTLSTLRSVPYR